MLRTGLLTRLALMGLGGLSMLYARWRIMGTGPPAFTEVDNPASFAENIFQTKHIASLIFHKIGFVNSFLQNSEKTQ